MKCFIVSQKKAAKPVEKTHEDQTLTKAGELTSKLQQSLYNTKEEVKGLSLMKRLNPANQNLGIGMTLVEGTPNFPMGINHGLFSMVNDQSKIKRRIELPRDSNFNYTGILIGPKGNNQKQLEERTGCKVMLRGKGSQNPCGDAEDEE